MLNSHISPKWQELETPVSSSSSMTWNLNYLINLEMEELELVILSLIIVHLSNSFLVMRFNH